MNLTDDELREFIRMWQEEFQEAISMDYARKRAGELVELYTALAQTAEASGRHLRSDVSDEVLSLLPEIN